jgi:hypothetical protein
LLYSWFKLKIFIRGLNEFFRNSVVAGLILIESSRVCHSISMMKGGNCEKQIKPAQTFPLYRIDVDADVVGLGQ